MKRTVSYADSIIVWFGSCCQLKPFIVENRYISIKSMQECCFYKSGGSRYKEYMHLLLWYGIVLIYRSIRHRMVLICRSIVMYGMVLICRSIVRYGMVLTCRSIVRYGMVLIHRSIRYRMVLICRSIIRYGMVMIYRSIVRYNGTDMLLYY